VARPVSGCCVRIDVASSMAAHLRRHSDAERVATSEHTFSKLNVLVMSVRWQSLRKLHWFAYCFQMCP
jgi:hypothetical protein